MKLFALFFVSCLVSFVLGGDIEKSSTIKPENVYNLSFSIIESVAKEKNIKNVLSYPVLVNIEDMYILFKTKEDDSFIYKWKNKKWNLSKNDNLNFMFSAKGNISFDYVKKLANNCILNKINIFKNKKIYSIEFKSRDEIVLFVAELDMKFGLLIGGGDIYKCEYIDKKWNIELKGGFDM